MFGSGTASAREEGMSLSLQPLPGDSSTATGSMKNIPFKMELNKLVEGIGGEKVVRPGVCVPGIAGVMFLIRLNVI